MSFLLKIVQGPNAGAEIALTEGVNLSVGSGDACDIILSDASVSERAFELEVTSERVVAVLEGGKAIKLEPFHVSWLGTTAVVVGPQEGTWKELVWPSAEKNEVSEVAVEEEATDKDAEGAPAKEKSSSKGTWISAVILLLLLAIVAFLVWKYPTETKTTAKKSWAWVKSSYSTFQKKVTQESTEPLPIRESLEDVASAYGFNIASTNGTTEVKGEFTTRRERLEATARAYAAKPGILVDFVDKESLTSAIDELLNLVSDGLIKLDKIEGRKAFLSGKVSSRNELRKILESLSADVPKVAEADCSKVIVGSGVVSKIENDDIEPRYQVPRVKAVRSEVKPTQKKDPKMPVIGILTVPYPCLVLADGTRAMEGARFDEYVIEKIEADSVTVRGGEGTFIWRP